MPLAREVIPRKAVELGDELDIDFNVRDTFYDDKCKATK